MSSSKSRSDSLPRRAALAGLAATLLLGACSNVRPLYGSLDGGTSPVAGALRNVDVKLADSRISQRIRNELLFAFYGGGEPGPAAYRLTLRVTDASGSGLRLTS